MNRENDIGTLMKAIINAKDAEENRRLRQFGITAGQMHVLLHLYDSDHYKKPLKELEKDMHVSQSTMAKLVKNLVDEKGFISYAADPKDKRIKWAQLNKKALPICENAESIVNRMENQLQKNLNKDEVYQLRSMLQRIYAGMKEDDRNEK